MNHDGDAAAMDVSSWFDLSQPSSSTLTPLPFEYTPPTCPFNPQTFFLSDIMNPGLPPPAAATYQEQDMVIQPPFPWATLKPATVHTLDHLLYELNLKTISGTLECKSCKFQQTDFRFDLRQNFEKVTKFLEDFEMNNRAPDVWMKPVLPNCRSCGGKSTMQPLIGKKEEINWLFLFLGEMIGCCNLEHLKYFCKHAKIHRTGAKDRLLYQIYLSLCKQLQPEGPFGP